MREMTEGQARFVDSISKMVAIIGAIAVGGWTLYTYFATRTKEAETSAVEARKPFEAERLRLYVEASSAAATLATSADSTARQKANEDFWRLYWGPLALVEDKSVEASMVRFGRCIQDAKSCDATQQQLALQLAHDCRTSLAVSWGVNLEELTKDKLEQLRH